MSTRATATLHTLGGALLTIALIRLTSTTSSLPYWETDPAIQFIPETTLTPAMSLMFDAITWLLCAFVFSVLGFAKRSVQIWMVLAAMVSSTVALAHGVSLIYQSESLFGASTISQDLVRGSLWASSMIAAVTLAHLASDRSFKRLCFACLGGVAVYLSAKGFFQVFVEYPRYLAEFAENKDRILAAQGMAPGSPQALIFERRVRQPEATGWGGLSNSYATVVAAGALAWLALTICARKAVKKDRAGLLGVTAIAGLASVAALWFSGSRAGLGIALLVAVAIPLSTRIPKPLARWSIVGLCAAAVLGVVAQGILGPDSGDLSIYFRALYWQGAAGVFADAPILGIGAGSFKDAFLLHRPRLCPEEVESAHNVFIDWLTAIGIFAIPWIWIVCASLVRTMRSVVEPPKSETDESGGGSRFALTLIVLAVFTWGAWLEWPLLLPDELFVRALGALLWIGAGATYFSLAPKLSPRAEPLIWALMACAIAVHSMIEMTLSMNTTVMWGLAVIGAGVPPSDRAGRKTAALWCKWFGVLAWSVSVVLVIKGLERFDGEHNMRRAAELSARHTFLEPSATSEADEINDVFTSLMLLHTKHVPSDDFLASKLGLCARLAELDWSFEDPDRALQARTICSSIVKSASQRGVGRSLTLLFFSQNEERAAGIGNARLLAQTLADRDPWGLEPAKAVYLLNRGIGTEEEARAAAIRLLEVHDAKRLDPLRGLSETELAEVRAFLASLEASE